MYWVSLMRGIAVGFMILLILAIIVLVAGVFIVMTGRGAITTTTDTEALRQCCWNLKANKYDISDTTCKVSWSETAIPISQLAGKVGISTTNAICEFCGFEGCVP